MANHSVAQKLSKMERNKVNEQGMPISELRRILRYEPSTGKLYWKVPAKGRALSKEAGRKCVHGYRDVSIVGVRYKSHRVAFAIVNGRWPVGELDHINHVRDDNKIENLKEVDRTVNGRNMSLSKANKSGIPGVRWNNAVQRYEAYIHPNRNHITLGYFKDFFEACCARKSANNRFSFHNNHGSPLHKAM